MHRRVVRTAAALCLMAAVAACSGSSNGNGSQNPSPPAAPVGVSATPGNAQVTLTWSTVSGATSYNLYRATTAANATKAAGTKIAGVTSGYVDHAVTNATTYYYVVTAVNAAGESAESAAVSATPVPPAPAAPTGVVATPGNAAVTLTWPAVSGATSYNVYYSTSAGVTTSTGTKVAGATSGTPIALSNGTTYYFIVTAVNAGGESAASAVVSAVPSATPAPAAPIGVAAAAGDQTVTLTWSAVTGATSYNVYWATTAANATKASGTKVAGATSGTPIAGFQNTTTYYLVVTAVNANGESTESATVSATPLPPAPAAPTGVVAAAGNGQVTLTWPAVTGATSYNVYYSTSTGVTPSNGTKVAGAASGTPITLSNGTTYYFVVTAVNAGGESTASSQVSATPQPPAPTAPTGVVATAGDGQVTLTWLAVTGATSYNVYYSTSTGVTTSTGTKVAGAASGTPITLSNGTTYYFVVTAVNGGGESSASSEVNAKPMPGLPGTPTGLTATAGAAQVSLAWTAVTGATSYNVYWSTTTGVTPSNGTKATVATNSWVHTGLPATGTTYYYVVTAVNMSGESAASVQASAVPVPVTYTVSGTVSYSGTATGRIYVGVVAPGCTGCSADYGTSIAAPGAFTIRGVPPGSYQIVAWRDTIGMGIENATFPSGASGSFSITSGNVSGLAVTLADPTPPAPAVPTGLGAIAGDGGGFFAWKKITDANGNETVSGYDVSWGTDTNASTNGGTASVAAHKDAFLLVGLTNGTSYYFKVRSKVGTTTSAWSTPAGPFTPHPATGGYTVSGTISTSATPTGPLYVALGTPQGPPVYVARIGSPSGSQAYSIPGVAAGTYALYAIYDQNNDGVVGPGDLADVHDGGAPLVAVSGNTTQNLTLPAVDASASAPTNHFKQGASESYSLGLKVFDGLKQVVAATLVSGTGLATPVDVGRSWGNFELWPWLGSYRPTIGSTYGFNVTYADGSTGTVTATVTTVLDSCPQSLVATPTPSNVVPTFSWAAPASPPAGWYGYQLQVNGNAVWWNYPNDGLMPSTQTSAQYNADGNAPSLVSGTPYTWQVSVQDGVGNSCSQGASYTP